MKICNKHELFQDALGFAMNKPLRWQYIPDVDINSPIKVLEKAYKVFNLNDYSEKYIEFGSNRRDWEPLCADDEPEEREPEYTFLLQLSKITTNRKLSQLEKIRKINKLCYQNAEIAEEYLEFDEENEPGDVWFREHA